MVLEVRSLKWIQRAAHLLEVLGKNPFPCLFQLPVMSPFLALGPCIVSLTTASILISSLSDTDGFFFFSHVLNSFDTNCTGLAQISQVMDAVHKMSPHLKWQSQIPGNHI